MEKKPRKRSKEAMERQARVAKEKIASGLCANCRKPREAHRIHNWNCQACAEKHKAQVSARRKKLRAAYAGLGICNLCFKNEPMPGRKICGRCDEIYSERRDEYMQRKRKRGQCLRCREYLSQEELDKGFVQCVEHRARGLKSQLRSQARKRGRATTAA